MLLGLRFIAVLLFCVACSARAELHFTSSTVSWDEDVLLSDGTLLPIQRTVKWGPSSLATGSRQLREQTIRFVRDGRTVEWNNSDLWLIPYTPDILDFVDGMPVLIMPVYRWMPCYKYGFPTEGLVAFGYRNGRWERLTLADLPKELKVNLARSLSEIDTRKEVSDKRITPADKKTQEGVGWGKTRQGQSIPEITRFYASYDEPCVKIRPPAKDERLEALRQRAADAERNAPTVPADLLSLNTEPESATPEVIRNRAESVASNCKGIVGKASPIVERIGDERGYAGQLTGYEILFQNAPAGNERIPIPWGGGKMQRVVCDHSTVFVVGRHGKEILVVFRFSPGGDLVDAFRVPLPDADKVVPGTAWALLWSVEPDEKGGLLISLVDYPANNVVSRRANYVARLPSR